MRTSLTAASALAVTAPARADAVTAGPRGQFARNVEVVGYTDMDHRPAFKMAVRQVRGRWYLYTGHFWHSGWSVVDVSYGKGAAPHTISTTRTCSGRATGSVPEDRLVAQTEDVVVDRRGCIYISDQNQGVHILRYTG
ncbi:hypothetical protein HD597_012428 [Nonomuraea thailandensis]|uniref:Uncharacterized protein n=1 Tax=Nonomuraea thailandensis TaxID=1188745 RepID=A0A9X2K9S4_9ACTN|nr:hypothetical protein [Nonomuraea thailandensis]MCP2365408.1 hypothetical protein [Nonomuraea thailandensis]